MSMDKKIRDAAMAGAVAATQHERERCIWVLTRMVAQAEKGLNSKLLSPAELQLSTVRLELTKVIVKAAIGLIAAGVQRPKEQSDGKEAPKAD